MHYACIIGSEKVVIALLTNGADPVARDFSDKIPGDYVTEPNLGILKLLESSNQKKPLSSANYSANVI